MNSEGICIIISAPSGGGKTSVINALLSRMERLRHSISYTTRPPRQSGTDKTDYHFIDAQTFELMLANDEFLEWAIVHGNCYGTRRKDLEKLLSDGFDVVLDIDTQGARQLREKLPEAIQIFIMPPSLEILEKRLRERQSDPEVTIQKRLSNAKMEVQNYMDYDYIVINDDLNMAIDQMMSILIAEHCRTRRFDVNRYLKGLK